MLVRGRFGRFDFNGAPLDFFAGVVVEVIFGRFSVLELSLLAALTEKKLWIPFRFNEFDAKGFFVAEEVEACFVDDGVVKKDEIDV
jgi:hypothetical protein